jgi:hypothetical protein
MRCARVLVRGVADKRHQAQRLAVTPDRCGVPALQFQEDRRAVVDAGTGLAQFDAEIGALGFLHRHPLEPQERALVGAGEHVTDKPRGHLGIERGQQGEICADRAPVSLGQTGCRDPRRGGTAAENLADDVSHPSPQGPLRRAGCPTSDLQVCSRIAADLLQSRETGL